LSNTKPTYARLETFYEIDDFDKDIIAGLKFYLKDSYTNMKVGTGHILVKINFKTTDFFYNLARR
jgi:hypothetical protein